MNTKAARRAFEISDSAILRRIIQARAMVAGSDADILFAAMGIMDRDAPILAQLGGLAYGAELFGKARAVVQLFAVGLDEEGGAS
jgi:hypothetical protein